MLALDEYRQERQMSDVEEHVERADEQRHHAEQLDREEAEHARERNREQHQRAPDIGRDEDRSPAQPIDPHAGEEPDDQDGRAARGTEQAHLPRGCGEGEGTDQRQRERGDL